MIQPVQGKIYAFDERHRQIFIVCERNQQNIIIQPEHWDSTVLEALFDQQIVIYAKGLENAHFPMLMRAEVQYLSWQDQPVKIPKKEYQMSIRASKGLSPL